MNEVPCDEVVRRGCTPIQRIAVFSGNSVASSHGPHGHKVLGGGHELRIRCCLTRASMAPPSRYAFRADWIIAAGCDAAQAAHGPRRVPPAASGTCNTKQSPSPISASPCSARRAFVPHPLHHFHRPSRGCCFPTCSIACPSPLHLPLSLLHPPSAQHIHHLHLSPPSPPGPRHI